MVAASLEEEHTAAAIGETTARSRSEESVDVDAPPSLLGQSTILKCSKAAILGCRLRGGGAQFLARRSLPGIRSRW
jgi:hypothetical protein